MPYIPWSTKKHNIKKYAKLPITPLKHSDSEHFQTEVRARHPHARIEFSRNTASVYPGTQITARYKFIKSNDPQN